MIKNIFTMKSRIIEFLKAENKTSAQLAEEIGVQPSGISHILAGRNKPSLDFVLKMLEKYKFLSTEWLLFGKGDMYKEPSMQRLADESAAILKDDETNGKKDFPVSDVKTGEKTPHNDDLQRRRRNLSVEKIVWFYSDGSFREYFPGIE